MGLYQEYSSITQTNKPRDATLSPISDGLSDFSHGFHWIEDHYSSFANYVNHIPVIGSFLGALLDNPAISGLVWVLSTATAVTDVLQTVIEPLENNALAQWIYHGHLGSIGMDRPGVSEERAYLNDIDWQKYRSVPGSGPQADSIFDAAGEPRGDWNDLHPMASVTNFIPMTPGSSSAGMIAFA
jgi:hypothetical protein